MNGKHIGVEHAAKINVILNEMRDACAGDPEALIEAASVISRLFSLSNEDAPLTQVVRQMRREAIIAMYESGMSDQQIADKIGMSRSRVQQLRTNASEGARKSEQVGRRRPAPAPVQMEALTGFDAA